MTMQKLCVDTLTSPEGILQVDLANRDCDEVFAFDRTQSRLQEMGSNEYLRSRWTGQKADTD
jgi:predicted ATPase